MAMTEDDLQPPTNIKEMGIHMFYLRRDMSVLSTDMSKLAEAVQKFTENAVPRKEFDDYKIEQTIELTEIKKALSKKPWMALILGGTFSALLTSLVIYMVMDLINKS